MQPKTILFILPDLETGGAERIVTTLANHLPRAKFLPKILLLRKQGGFLNILKADVAVIDINTERIRNSLFPIVQEIRRLKPDIVFSGFGEINVYLSAVLRAFPKTVFVARETNVVSRHVSRPEIRFFYKFYNAYQKIICQSDDMLEDLRDNFSVKAQKLVKINNPVDFDFIDNRLNISEKPESFNKGSKHVVAIGNLATRKGFDQLLDVFLRLKGEDIKLHIVGDGIKRDELYAIKESLQLDNVIFEGKQENPYRFLKFADLFVLSSRYEGFPNVLLEAGACGVFSLANNCPGGINEIIQQGVNGEIENITNPQLFADRIKVLVQQTFDKDSIRSSIKSRFDKELILRQYTELLSGL